MKKIFYHTQEARGKKLKTPIPCTRDDAWLGEGFYFWYELEDAEYWGNTAKRKTGKYDIYESEIDCIKILDTVFNEEHYFFWYKQIEKVAKTIIKKTKLKPSLKELNDYFKERGTWNEVDGILFQDLPANPNRLLIKPIRYRNRNVIFTYRKRIQVAIYNTDIIITFALLKSAECNSTN
ncbi:MAG: hypothetical protein LC100_12290 [Chitinophagales bacterium]|nr:hypothetical protein [Chitinophagales bacterium]